MVSSNCSSLSTSTYYRCYDSDPEVECAARILMSFASSSFSSSSRKFSPVPNWSKTRKQSQYDCFVEESLPIRSDDNVLVEESIPIRFDDRLIKELMDTFDELVMKKSVGDALKDLKVKYKSSKAIIAGIESFEYLRSEGLDKDEMLKVVKAISIVNGEEKKKINSYLVLNKKSPKKMKMKMKNVVDLTGEDDESKGNMRNYPCNERKEVFINYPCNERCGHTASHNKKKEERIQTSSNVTKIKTVSGNVGGEVLVYKCDLFPKSFPKGQTLGGHKTAHRNPGERKESSSEQVVKIQDFDLNMVAPDVENHEFISSPKSQNYSFSSEEDRD